MKLLQTRRRKNQFIIKCKIIDLKVKFSFSYSRSTDLSVSPNQLTTDTTGSDSASIKTAHLQAALQPN